MNTPLVFYIEVDLKAVMRFKKMTAQRRKKIFDRAGTRYTKYLRNRYLGLSAMVGGSSTWPKLEDITVKSKEKRGIANNPKWILREGDELLNGMSFVTNPSGFTVGYMTPEGHPRFEGTLGQLASIHQEGNSNLPSRKILIKPTAPLYRLLVRDIQQSIGDVIREVNL